jgi:glycosyltransferase involved in cell wall biosynthesis
MSIVDGLGMVAGRTQFARRVRQLRAAWQAEGPRWVMDRARHALATRMMPTKRVAEVRPEDVLAADLAAPPKVAALPHCYGQQMLLNWVMEPPAAGSGGHTTIFRMIHYLEANGFTNRIYFYDPYRADHAHFVAIVRDYFSFKGPVQPIGHGMADAHALIATGWPTAYPVYNARSAGEKFYFVQDFEPAFYATSSVSVLAENTYRMGLHAITAGSWLAGRLRRDYGMQAEHFDFGCDAGVYQHSSAQRARNGVAFYARPSATRRAFEIGVMALQLLAERRPDLDLHLYGKLIGPLPFRFIDHGLVSPRQLNDIYNLCFAGLSLSLTNVSLVPHEMLAAGCIPVVNDAEQNRLVLDNDHVRYATLTPHALAMAIEDLASCPDLVRRSLNASASVRRRSWDSAGLQVANILRGAPEGR